MTYFLDTNICIYLINRKYPELAHRMLNYDADEIKLPSIVLAELQYGAEKSKKRDLTLLEIKRFTAPFDIVPFDASCAVSYGKIRSDLERAGTPIGPNDLQIAATVMSHGGILVTHNTKEFQRVPGLMIEDWAESES
jgi:tRNA(fMet)-specific endonuclease VapC